MRPPSPSHPILTLATLALILLLLLLLASIDSLPGLVTLARAAIPDPPPVAQLVNTAPPSCLKSLRNGMRKTQCMKKIRYGCGDALTWVGKGCPRNAKKAYLRDDGGCQPRNYCGWGCRARCIATRGCVWYYAQGSPSGKTGCFRKFALDFQIVLPLPSDPNYGYTPSSTVISALEAAVGRWSNVLYGNAAGWGRIMVDTPICNGLTTVPAGTLIDDSLLMVVFQQIDGWGGRLGAGGPCLRRRAEDQTTAVGAFILDVADIETWFEPKSVCPQGCSFQLLVDFFTHEIGHALGFGYYWPLFPSTFLKDWDMDNPPLTQAKYIGAWGVSGFRRIGGGPSEFPDVENSVTGACCPVSGSHWKETTFPYELMSPYLDEGSVLSEMTALSLQDLGYQVNKHADFEIYYFQQESGRRRTEASGPRQELALDDSTFEHVLNQLRNKKNVTGN